MNQFEFKPFEEMTREDYKKIGFKSGLEIHQQLLTEKKLFCRCPAGKYSKNFDAEILRHMRPTLSELGEYDGTALMEYKTKKNIIYRIKRETVCTYEMDDTPPFLINEEALDIALLLGLQFGCSIVDELHIARKQYLDGSIPTGFQRTAIYALDGKIPFGDKFVDIVQMSIEEDSCREVSDIGHDRVYLTDRLGMPLIETVTAPQLETPDEAAEAAKICSRVVRSTGKVRTGAGAAREDVNVSVSGGTRIEIKGVSKISMIPLLTYNEAKRQWNLLKLRDELRRRGITEDTFEAEEFDVTRIIKSVNYTPLRDALNSGFRVKAVKLKKFSNLLHWETQTDTFFSKEISDRVRVIACLTKIPNIIHSDSRGETLTSAEWKRLRNFTDADYTDTIVLVWGDERDTRTAVNEIIIRAKEAAVGIPSETRQALPDGTNGFERILPGAERMYPDTDLPPLMIDENRIEKIKSNLQPNYWKFIEEFRQTNIPYELLLELSISKYSALFAECAGEWKIKPMLAAEALIQFPKRIKRAGMNAEIIDVKMMERILYSYSKGLISKDGILPILKKSVLKGKFYPELLPKPLTDEEINNVVLEEAEKLKKIKIKYEDKKRKILMGMIMNRIRISADGRKVKNILNKIIEKI